MVGWEIRNNFAEKLTDEGAALKKKAGRCAAAQRGRVVFDSQSMIHVYNNEIKNKERTDDAPLSYDPSDPLKRSPNSNHGSPTQILSPSFFSDSRSFSIKPTHLAISFFTISSLSLNLLTRNVLLCILPIHCIPRTLPPHRSPRSHSSDSSDSSPSTFLNRWYLDE